MKKPTAKKPHPWEDPPPPGDVRRDTWFKWGWSAPDAARNPALWPVSWMYGKSALDSLRRLAARSRRVLDIRCGSGWLLWEAAKVAPQAQLLGLDTRAEAVAWGQAQCEVRLGRSMGQVEIRQQDFLDFESEPASYDLIICSFALHQWSDASALLEKMQLLLKPGGHVFYYDATEPTEHTVDRLSRYYFRRQRLRGVATDLWNVRRQVRAGYAKDSLRSLRHPEAPSEGEFFAVLQSQFAVLEQGRLRALCDLWLRSLPKKLSWLWLIALLWLDRLVIAFKWLDGCRRFAVARKEE